MKNQGKERSEVFALLKEIISEVTGNKLEEIRENSLIYNELNLTEYDLQRILKEVGAKLEIGSESLNQMVKENEEITSVGDVLDLIVDEKELG